MQIYVFSSNNLTNIWAGVGAGMWAVSLKLASNKGTITKARKVKIGSIGILYCSSTGEFTTPFIFKTIPEAGTEVGDVWDAHWGLPFQISPLGSPRKRLSNKALADEMPSVVASGKHWTQFLRVPPSFSFQASDISGEDWAFLFGRLGN